MRRSTVTLSVSAALSALCVAMIMSMMPGCTAADRAKAGEAAVFVEGLADELELRKDDPVGDVAELVQTKLSEMHSDGLLFDADYHASLTALNEGLEHINASLPAPEKVDTWIGELRRVQATLQAIADAPDETAAIAEGIAGAAAMAAPMAGPYGPWIALGGAALASIISAIGAARAGRSKGLSLGLDLGVQRTALPIDDARDVGIEQALAESHPGRRFLVVDRDKVAKGHVRNGVATTIEKVTTATA